MNKQVLEGLKAQGYRPRTLLDVGAHVGSFALQFLQVYPECVPVLIEPNPFCQTELSKLPFEKHEIAASDKPGRAELFLSKEWLQSTGSSLYRENTHFFRDEAVIKREIDKARIDDLFQGRQFDFVKIDTQGSELDVLRGGQEVLRHADYILIEVSLVEYNIGGARAEDLFSQLTAMGFHCTEVTDFHRLAGIQNGNLLQLDFLFERRTRRFAQTAADPARLASLRALAQTLQMQGRSSDALLILEQLAATCPSDAETLRPLAQLLGSEGRTLDAIEKLAELKAVTTDMEALVGDIQGQIDPAIQRFNAHLAAGEVEKAERYAAALVALIPRNAALLDAALSCNLALGRKPAAANYAATLLSLNAGHAGARAFLEANANPAASGTAEVDPRVEQALSPKKDTHPLIALRDMHDAASALLCRPLDPRSVAQIEQLIDAAGKIEAGLSPGSELAGWEKHYRLMFDAIDLASVQGATPGSMPESEIELMTSSGTPLNWLELRATAARQGARTIFYAAADRTYVDLYARWYMKSILKYCDVPCLVILHVIGGRGELRPIAKSVGVRDKRVIFSADAFDAGSVTTKCYDTPPKGMIAKPVAHLQSVRFLSVGSFLRKMELPIFVSDIDLLLQRGVEDLLQRCAETDVVFNENTLNTNAGSRLTANLLLLSPTDNAQLFLRFLQSYLNRVLAGPEVTRWIDQFALLLARHHLQIRGRKPRIAYFDTNSDINNVMYTSYQNHPFRFLSLYHGFDTSSLEDNPNVLGEAAPGKPRSAKPRRKRQSGSTNAD
jgi:FkbM family methyltransferase